MPTGFNELILRMFTVAPQSSTNQHHFEEEAEATEGSFFVVEENASHESMPEENLDDSVVSGESMLAYNACTMTVPDFTV